MPTYLARITIGLLISAFPTPLLAVTGEASDRNCSPEDRVPLDESDLQLITLQMLEKHPQLSSSPGIKVAEAWCEPTADHADIIFYPYAERAGIKEALRVQCTRGLSDDLWSCDHVARRRYMQLETQDFEVRVVGNIGIKAALALIEATRRTAQASASDGSAIPEAAILILPAGNGYYVGWGSDDGQQTLSVEAKLKKDGNPVDPEDWQTSVLPPSE